MINGRYDSRLGSVLKGKSQLWCKKFLSHLLFAKPSLTISNMTIFIPYIDSIVRLRLNNAVAENKAGFSPITIEIRDKGGARSSSTTRNRIMIGLMDPPYRFGSC